MNEPAGDPGDLGSLIREGQSLLEAAGLDTPDHDARLLLAEAAGCDLHDLDKGLLLCWDLTELTRMGSLRKNKNSLSSGQVHPSPASVDQLSLSPVQASPHALLQYRDWIGRRAQREPLQYILGHCSFRMLDLLVGPGVFIPRVETEIVVQAGLDSLQCQGLRHPCLVDLCAGSGAVGLALATEVESAEVWAVENSAGAFPWTEKNAKRQSDSIRARGSDYHLLFGDATSREVLSELDGRVDLVISNPPYVPMNRVPEQPEVKWDPDEALYGGSPDGCRVPAGIIRRSVNLLNSHGILIMEHDCEQGRAMRELARDAGFVHACTGSDLTGRDRFLLAFRGENYLVEADKIIGQNKEGVI